MTVALCDNYKIKQNIVLCYTKSNKKVNFNFKMWNHLLNYHNRFYLIFFYKYIKYQIKRWLWDEEKGNAYVKKGVWIAATLIKTTTNVNRGQSQWTRDGSMNFDRWGQNNILL